MIKTKSVNISAISVISVQSFATIRIQNTLIKLIITEIIPNVIYQ
jgi:hypothetical protein